MDDNKTIVLKFFDAFSSNNFDKTMAFLDDSSFEWWIPGNPAAFPLAGSRNKTAFGELLKGATSKCKDGIKIKVHSMISEGDQVSAEAESFAEVGDKKYNNHYHFLITLHNGKLIGVKEYMDTMHANDVLCA